MRAGVDEDQAEAARKNLGSALNTAEELPSGVGRQLVENSQQAFSDGLALAAGFGAGLCLLGAILGTVLLRSIDFSPAEADAERVAPQGLSVGPPRPDPRPKRLRAPPRKGPDLHKLCRGGGI